MATMFLIEDENHSEWIAEFATRELAMAELRRLVDVPWDQAPNRAPCTSSRTCGRNYELIEYDDSREPWRELARSAVLKISATEVRWLHDEK
jgi:hypothetical protein